MQLRAGQLPRLEDELGWATDDRRRGAALAMGFATVVHVQRHSRKAHDNQLKTNDNQPSFAIITHH